MSRVLEAAVLAERDLGRHAAGGGLKEMTHRLALGPHHVPPIERGAEAFRMDRTRVGVDQPGAVELAQDPHDAAGAMHVLHVDVALGRRHLAQARHAARQPVDVGHGERHLALVGGGQEVEHRIGRPAHGDVERHGVLEGCEVRDGAGQDRHVVLLVVPTGHVDDEMAGLDEEAPAVGMGGERGAVARQGEAEGLGEAVHGIGREHARAGPAGRAGRTFDDFDLFVGHVVVGRRHHGVDEVERLDLAAEVHLAGLHRAARHEDGRHVEAQARHQHAGRDLVAVGDAHHGVGAMRVDHIFDAVGDDLATGQAVQHAVMAHRDAVVDCDRVELLGDATRGFDLAGHELAEVLEMDVARHELGETVDDRDDRLAEIAVLHSRGAPQAPGAGHVAAMGRRTGSIGGHRMVPDFGWS